MNNGELRSDMVWINGAVGPSSEAVLSVQAPGVALGLGCFETMCVENGKLFRFYQHYSRLHSGAVKLGMTPPLVDHLSLAVLELVEVNGYAKSRCRVRISCYLDGDSNATVITTSKMPVRASTSSLVLSPYRVNEHSPLVGVKSSSYAMNLIALREAQRDGADEALMLNTSGELCEGATSNLFLVKNGEVLTPPLESGCLPGIAREAVIELCGELGDPCFERALTLADLHNCDGAFLTSSLRRIQPITALDRKPVRTTGKVTDLQSSYQALVHGSK
ncbi:MAG: aminotransferase class IV [Rubritalea sp.]|uniref:aminotransferase class IV n=1 Tax=Rubritalea sp. TaxID=2109375 RepID=UPI003242ECB1